MNVILKLLKAAAILIVVTLIGCFIANKWCHISPSVEYDWYMGIWHGIFIVPNWAMSLVLDKHILCQAPHHTAAYMIWWWILLIFHTYMGYCAYGAGTSNKKDRKRTVEDK